MLEAYVEAAHTLASLRSGPTGPFVDDFADSLCGSGYSRSTGREYLRAAAHVGAWMRLGGVSLDALDEEALDAFVEHLSACSCFSRSHGDQIHAVGGARRFLAFLREQAAVPPRTHAPALPQILELFEDWMHRHRGITESTLSVYRRILVELLDTLGDPALFTAAALRAFVAHRAGRHGRSRAKTVMTAVRVFLRHLVAQGLCAPPLVDALPTVAEWRLSSLPRYLSPEDVERILVAPDLATAVGRRDRAILLLLSRLGLRAGDVVALRLGDIDWQAGTVQVRGKGRRVSKLPLPQDAGDAILAYLADGRPAIDEQHVFLRARAPNGKLGTSSAVSSIVKTAATSAKVEMACGRAHALRQYVSSRTMSGNGDCQLN